MSAYGDIRRAHNAAPLQPTSWLVSPIKDSSVKDTHQLQQKQGQQSISIYHLNLETARALPGLLDYLGTIFAQVIEDGRTYPQEGEMPQTTFEAYFFSADVFVGIVDLESKSIVGYQSQSIATGEGNNGAALGHCSVADKDIQTQRGERSWEECVAGYYYIKPNYPGRSSHICNAGFVVPPIHRKKGYGLALAKSYVHYAPQLGYQASVFNLVYVNNIASVKLWDDLGFTRAGRIPRAGRLRTEDGKGEEYVDAYVMYKSFIEE